MNESRKMGFFITFCLVVLLTGWAGQTAADADSKLVRATISGQIRGMVDDTTGTLVWRGVPFAKPPVGELRWRAPQEPERWTGIRETIKTAVKCAQPSGGSEDCLYLDIARPGTDEVLPVYVWIHGGGNSAGSAGSMDQFAKFANVVTISIQYRLGPIGSFKHEALFTGDRREDSGNFGLMDQIAALRWVKNNISSFGGDLNAVTVGGESAGASNILALLTVPEAFDLFDRAVVESGSIRTAGDEQARRQSAGYVKNLGIESTWKELARELRALSAEKIIRSKPPSARFGSVPDGKFVPDSRECAFIKGNYKKMPILMGSNRNEYSAWLLWGGGPGGKWGQLWQTLPKAGDKEISDILDEEEQKTFSLASSAASRVWQARGTHYPARLMTKFQDNVYIYDFQWGGTKGSKIEFVLGASHANELGYFYYGGEWDWMGQGASITEESRNARHALSNAMATYLAQFIHTGNPNGKADLPVWKTWSNEPAGVKTMNFDASSESGSSALKLYMTKREYLMPEILKEVEDSGDKVAMEWVRRRAARSSTVPECD